MNTSDKSILIDSLLLSEHLRMKIVSNAICIYFDLEWLMLSFDKKVQIVAFT